MYNRRFLVLDDDPAVGQTIAWLAEDLGFETKYASHASEFFQIFEEWQPDFVTMDLVMPGLDGVEVMRILAERKANTNVIITSGMGSRVLEAARRSALEHGLPIAGVLSKPLSRQDLQALVQPCLEEPALLPAGAGATMSSHREITAEDLSTALDQDQFSVFYQPKIHCATGELAGLEALLRWTHPIHGAISPACFVPLAEGFGLIDRITSRVFDRALPWFALTFPDPGVDLSLNVSACSLVDFAFADSLARRCAACGVSTSRIVLELTETAAMVDPLLTLDLMTRFRMKGFELSIDDFGTGYSSMIQLARLPFSEIKVDQSFVKQAGQSRESRTIIQSIVDLGHNLGLRVVAEGVEDTLTLELLRTLGCDLAQGYLVAPPLAAIDVDPWRKEWASQPFPHLRQASSAG